MLQEAVDYAATAEKHGRQRQSWLARKAKLKKLLAEARRQLGEARQELGEARQQLASIQSSAVDVEAEAVCRASASRGSAAAVKQVRSDVGGDCI